MNKAFTASGEYVVFHTSDAGIPHAYPQQGWTFEPCDWDGGVFAPVFDTLEKALVEAEAWEYQCMLDDFSEVLAEAEMLL